MDAIMKYAETEKKLMDDARAKLAAHPDDDAVLLAVANDLVDACDQAREGTGLRRLSYDALMAQRQAEEREGVVQE